MTVNLIVTDGHPTLRHEERAALGSILQGQLIDLIELALLGKHLHWNLTGPDFQEMHEHLDELVEEWQGRADETAERGRALGIVPDGQARTVGEHSQLAPLAAGEIRTDAVIHTLLEALDETITRARERMGQSAEYDAVTEDLMIETVAILEKQRWMVASQR
ncbi:MAG TPA: DNA starvation/stationary phase protection protein [Solirubrobacteraceae bacterium]|nr:DNA starvation/stationary phase protection protein [Solirubrobacteraceae bacterium]